METNDEQCKYEHASICTDYASSTNSETVSALINILDFCAAAASEVSVHQGALPVCTMAGRIQLNAYREWVARRH